MKTISITNARKELYKLVDSAIKESTPVQITGKRGNAVLISEDDWRAIEETLYLLSIPGMRESIVEGMKTPLSETSEDPGW
ncbi:MAG: type II toxin-antitoxin system Phd/YefM family antitoxin [Melioribacteraceae bacterium]|nr:type II toxin-antitoxin system Phd/YefM family antitoxin [Melioribacteraceae bacterium]